MFENHSAVSKITAMSGPSYLNTQTTPENQTETSVFDQQSFVLH